MRACDWQRHAHVGRVNQPCALANKKGVHENLISGEADSAHYGVGAYMVKSAEPKGEEIIAATAFKKDENNPAFNKEVGFADKR